MGLADFQRIKPIQNDTKIDKAIICSIMPGLLQRIDQPNKYILIYKNCRCPKHDRCIISKHALVLLIL